MLSGRAAFAEYAEAIGISTLDVVGMIRLGDSTVVFYTRGVEDVPRAGLIDMPVFRQTLARGDGQLLVRVGPECDAGTLRELLGEE